MKHILNNNKNWLLVHKSYGEKDFLEKQVGLISIYEFGNYLLLAEEGPGRQEKITNKSSQAETHFQFSNHYMQGDSPAPFQEYYSMISFNGTGIKMSTDPLGISKLYYSNSPKGIVAGNNIWLVNRILKSGPSRINILKYVLFNYFTFGDTYFEEIRYLRRNQVLIVTREGKNEVKYKNVFYHRPQAFRETKYKDRIVLLSEFWQKLISSYRENESSATGLTLTAGFDSRMILSGMIQSGIEPVSYTFGNPGSRDAIIAAGIARRMGFAHYNCPSKYSVFSDFDKRASMLIKASNSMGNFLRDLRLESVDVIKQHTRSLVWGFAGSELMRGLYPDRLMASPFYLELNSQGWDSQSIENLVKSYLSFHKIAYTSADLVEISENLQTHQADFEPLKYLLDVIIPMHFGTDLLLFSRHGIRCHAPYINIDFIQLLYDLNLLALFKNNYQFKETHLRRIDNPRISSAVIQHFNRELASIELTKGYTPNEYLFSKYYAGLKFIKYKLTNQARYTTVFSYDNSYIDLIKNNLTQDKISAIDYDTEALLRDLGNTEVYNEINLSRFTRYLNLQLIEETT